MCPSCYCCSDSPHGETTSAEDSTQDVTTEHHTSDDGIRAHMVVLAGKGPQGNVSEGKEGAHLSSLSHPFSEILLFSNIDWSWYYPGDEDLSLSYLTCLHSLPHTHTHVPTSYPGHLYSVMCVPVTDQPR